MEIEIENKFSVLTKFAVYGTMEMAQQTNWLLSNHEDHVIVGQSGTCCGHRDKSIPEDCRSARLAKLGRPRLS